MSNSILTWIIALPISMAIALTLKPTLLTQFFIALDS